MLPLVITNGGAGFEVSVRAGSCYGSGLCNNKLLAVSHAIARVCKCKYIMTLVHVFSLKTPDCGVIVVFMICSSCEVIIYFLTLAVKALATALA